VAPTPLDWLLSLAQFGIKFGLENIRAIVEELGHPERQFRSIHIAGTNGKGSVTAIVEAAIRATGRRTGRYTSPHLLGLTERFAIDGASVEEDDLVAAVEQVRSAVERLRARGTLDVHPTFFEVTTAVAFELFRRHAVDVAVCEVGLGGRLDATNVLSPMACAITSIAFDHEQYLGHTLREIASEKAGIIKPSTPVVVGPLDPEAADAIRRRAGQCNAPVVWAEAGVRTSPPVAQPRGGQRFDLRTPARDYGEVHLALAGEHQVANAVVAVRLLEQLDADGLDIGREAIVRALATVRWPGRLERVELPDGREVLLDAAHNEAGAGALARHLSALGEPRPLVFAAMRDKDAAAMLRALAPRVSLVVVTRASNPRSAEPTELVALVRRVSPTLPVETADSAGEALARAWKQSPCIVAAGSIFLIADVMKELGRS
jgi:dihydrofolate synthase / folylpolyglutamate synthase